MRKILLFYCCRFYFYATEDKPTIVFFLGRQGSKCEFVRIIFRADVGHFLLPIATMSKKLDANILCMDYRGFGPSRTKENPSEATLMHDADIIMRYALTQFSGIYVSGYSLGSALATGMATKYKDHIAGLILIAPLTTLWEGVILEYPYLPMKQLFKLMWKMFSTQKFENIEKAKNIESPTFIMCGSKDPQTPLEMCHKVNGVISKTLKKVLVEVPNAKHRLTSIFKNAEVLEICRNFIHNSLNEKLTVVHH